jgi:hypothetical protein
MKFWSVVAVVFQSFFRSEMHQNNIFFYFLKFIFNISASKQSKNIKKWFYAKKIFFLGNTVSTVFPNEPYVQKEPE